MLNHHKSALRRSFEFIAIKARGSLRQLQLQTAMAWHGVFKAWLKISLPAGSPAALQIATRWVAWNSAN